MTFWENENYFCQRLVALCCNARKESPIQFVLWASCCFAVQGESAAGISRSWKTADARNVDFLCKDEQHGHTFHVSTTPFPCAFTSVDVFRHSQRLRYQTSLFGLVTSLFSVHVWTFLQAEQKRLEYCNTIVFNPTSNKRNLRDSTLSFFFFS